MRISGCSSDSGLARRTVRATSVVGVEPERGVAVGADERRSSSTSTRPWPASTSATRRRTRWRVGEPGAARGRREDRGDALVAVDAGDLLDEVLGGGEVGAPGGRGHREQVRRRGSTAQPIASQHRDDLALEVDDADELGREVDVHA